MQTKNKVLMECNYESSSDENSNVDVVIYLAKLLCIQTML